MTINNDLTSPHRTIAWRDPVSDVSAISHIDLTWAHENNSQHDDDESLIRKIIGTRFTGNPCFGERLILIDVTDSRLIKERA